MKRSIVIVTVITVVLVAGLFSIGQEEKGNQQSITHGGEQASNSPLPLILQDEDGDHLVHRAGPLGGVPFTIKVDSHSASQKISLFLPRSWPRSRRFRFISITMQKKFFFSRILGPASLSEIGVGRRALIRSCSFLGTRGSQPRTPVPARFTC
jgi:hypothetical protein